MQEYIDRFEGVAHERLVELYALIKKLLPDAKEKISYGVPTFYNENGYIVYFAGYPQFTSIYPVHLSAEALELAQPYLSGKSTARFLHDQPLPLDIIRGMVLALEASNKTRKK
jgi:uncharacterized protein YdhG (YjbR/CyaY superfamily)